VVAHADQLAVRGSREPGRAGAELTLRAARLRARLWRLEHREADALEASELFQSAARASPSDACAANLERTLLEGELRSDPQQLYRDAYGIRAARPEGACRARVDELLETLAAFRPLPNVLAEIDRRLAPAAPGVSASAVLPPSDAGATVVPAAAASGRGPLRITGIERYTEKTSARIVAHVTRPTTFQVGELPAADGRGPRLFVDVRGASYRGPHTLEAGGVVQRVRLGRQQDATRIVLDLESWVHRKVFYLPEPFRLVIDVSKQPPPGDRPETAGPHRVTRVVLDPGHGGNDPGATGPAGLREKDVTLDVAHRAAPLLARELGVTTLLTRDSDEYVALAERTARANAFGADLFVSVHCNASENGASRGVMTFVLDASPDAVALQIAARENAASPAAAAELATAMSQLLEAGSLARSVHFAELLQRATMASLAAGYADVPDGGVKRAGFYVLAGARMPAVLFEASFVSNPTDETRLDSGEYRQKLADGIVNAVRAYRDGR
jgi:N-acetylmuramoyl-L-alanine amidase